jgi:hypothetical protein
MVPAAAYFVVYLDAARGALLLEHYRKDGLLDAVIAGRTATELLPDGAVTIDLPHQGG